MRALLSEKTSCFYKIILKVILYKIIFFYFVGGKMYLHLFRKKYILVEAIRKHFYTFSSEMSIQRGVYTNRQKS